MKGVSMKKYILPAAAVIVVIAAVIVFLTVPKTSDQSSETPQETAARSAEAAQAGGVLEIPAADLSEDEVTFIRLAEDSKVELLARMGEDGLPKIALGTCQSCNGSPGAYYTQQGSELQCNNCGLTFPVSVVGEESEGCHPISIDPALVDITEDGITLKVDDLRGYEALFEAVEEH